MAQMSIFHLVLKPFSHCPYGKVFFRVEVRYKRHPLGSGGIWCCNIPHLESQYQNYNSCFFPDASNAKLTFPFFFFLVGIWKCKMPIQIIEKKKFGGCAYVCPCAEVGENSARLPKRSFWIINKLCLPSHPLSSSPLLLRRIIRRHVHIWFLSFSICHLTRTHYTSAFVLTRGWLSYVRHRLKMLMSGTRRTPPRATMNPT